MSNIIFDEAAHRYLVDGRELPSVTHICRFLTYDTASNAKPWMRKIAADRGSRVHAYTAMLDYGEPLDDSEIDMDCIGYVKAYRRFLVDYKPQWDGIETVMGSTKLGYAGTCDRYGTVGDVQTVMDIKTGSSVNGVVVSTQLTGYWYLLCERGYIASDCSVLLLRKDGTYSYQSVVPHPPLWDQCMMIHEELSKKGITIR